MSKILHEDKWEAIWLANAIMSYKLTIESEHKAKELDKQAQQIAEINEKLDKILSI